MAVVLLGLTAVASVTTIGSWFTGRRSRLNVRVLLTLAAIGIPVIGDLIAFSNAPAWM